MKKTMLALRYSDDDLGPAYSWLALARYYQCFDRYWACGLLEGRLLRSR